jgi:hypothetical protein
LSNFYLLLHCYAKHTLLVKNQATAKIGAAIEAEYLRRRRVLLFCCIISIGSIHRWLKTKRWRMKEAEIEANTASGGNAHLKNFCPNPQIKKVRWNHSLDMHCCSLYVPSAQLA